MCNSLNFDVSEGAFSRDLCSGNEKFSTGLSTVKRKKRMSAYGTAGRECRPQKRHPARDALEREGACPQLRSLNERPRAATKLLSVATVWGSPALKRSWTVPHE